jgi:cell wall-associated NlpC family hydrolase
MKNTYFQQNTNFLKPFYDIIRDVLTTPKQTETASKKGTSTTTQRAASTKLPADKPIPMSHINRQDAEAGEAKKQASAKIPAAAGSAATSTPRMSEIQKDEDAVRQRESSKKTTTELKAKTIILHEPIVKKHNPVRSGTEELEDRWRNPLNPGGALVQNGVKPRGETDTGTGDDAPIRFAGTSDDDRRRQYDAAMKRAASASDDLYQMLEWAKIDANNLTAEQDEVIDLVKLELIKKSVLGTLTTDEKQKILRRTQQYIYNETTSANGDSYPVYVDIVSGGKQLDEMFPALGTVDTSVLSEDDLKSVLEYGEQGSVDKDERETFKAMRKYKDRVSWEAIYAYNKDISLGRVEPGDFQDYYDQAVLKYFEGCIKPIPVQNQRGKEIGSVMIGYLISPTDHSLGAEVARKALEMMGTNHDELDCAQLVKRAFSQLNPDWGQYGIGSHAEYQRNKSEEVWPKNGEKFEDFQFKTGDLLYWENEDGETTHTAIYLGSGYMIESWHDVRITELRQKTHLGGGEVSTLYRVNRMTEGKLNENVEKYK